MQGQLPRKGFAIAGPGSTAGRVATVVAGALLCIGYVNIFLSGSPIEPGLMHNLTLTLIALGTYSLVVLPFGWGVVMNLAVLAVSLWCWATIRSQLLGFDVGALLLLGGIATFQQRRRLTRLHRLRQRLDDFDEEIYLKAQALRINRNSREKLQSKLDRYQRLQSIAEEFSRLTDLERVCRLAVDQAFELIGKSDVCTLLLANPDRQELGLQASHRASEVPVVRTKQGDQFDHYVLRTHRPLLVNDVRRDFRFIVAASAERSVASVIACPLLVGEQVAGVLRLDSRQRGVYTQDDLRFLDILLDLVGTALGNARLFAEVQRLATTDGLTGLTRKQPFMEQLSRELARTARTREPLAVLMLDIDEFKRYNDQFGHTAGDAALRSVAEVLRSRVPLGAGAARYGGEEFAVLLPGAERERALQLAEGIRQDIERLGQSGEAPVKRVTVSIGLASFPDDAQTELEIMRRADERLYQGKRAGRNRICSS